MEFEKEFKTLSEEIKAERDAQKQIVADLSKANEALGKKLADDHEAHELKIKTLSDQQDAIQLAWKDKQLGDNRSLFGDMKKKMTDKSFIETLKKGGDAEFELKVGATIDESTYLSNSALATAVIVPFREQGVGKAPDRQTTLLDLVSRGTINSNRVTWVERSARDEQAAGVAENAAYVQSGLTYIQRSKGVEKIGTFIKVNNEALEDWDQLMSEINAELFPMLERELERQCYVGTGDTPQIQGIIDTGFAPAYSLAALTGTVITPNHYDAASAALTMVEEQHYTANGIFIRPTDMFNLQHPKNADGEYLLPPFMGQARTDVNGVPIYRSTLVTAGDILVGDFKKILLYLSRGITIKIWDQEASDAINDRKTITASLRAVNRIRVPDYNAFCYDQFADIVADLKA